MSNLRIRSTTLTLILISILILASCGDSPGTETATDATDAAESPAVPTAPAVAPAAAGELSGEVTLAFYNISEVWDETLEQMVQLFEQEHPNIDVNLEIRPIDAYWDKLQTEFAAGTAPDITINQTNWVVPGAARGMFVDLKPYMDRDNVDLNAYWFPHEEDWGWRGGIYGGFSGAAGLVVYVNKDLLEAAGLEFPKEDWTWDDLLAYGEQLTDPAKNQWGIYINYPNPPYWSTSFIHMAGGTLLNEARDKCTLTSPEAQEGLQFVADLIHEKKVMPNPSALEGQENPFVTGNVGIYFGATWEEDQVRGAGFDWDFAHVPAHPTTGKRSVQVGTNAWSILSSSKNQDAAWEVVKFLMGEPGQRAIMSLSVPTLTEVVESEEYRELHAPQHIDVPISDFQEYGHGYYITPDVGEWWNAMAQETAAIWSGEATVAEATERACQAVDDVFARRPPEFQE